MTQEQIENIAKYATDSYFVNLPEQEKIKLIANPEVYLSNYTKVFLTSLEQVTKTIEQQKVKDELVTQFR